MQPAWKVKKNAKYDKKTIREMKKRIVQKAKQIKASGEKMDCADVAFAALIRSAEELCLPLRLRIYNAKAKKFEWWSFKNYKDRESFEKAIRANAGAINILDNTKKVKYQNVEPGDMIIYDLRYHRRNYTGHTMIIIEVKANKFRVIEGHLSGQIEESEYTLQQIKAKWRGHTRMRAGSGIGRTLGKSKVRSALSWLLPTLFVMLGFSCGVSRLHNVPDEKYFNAYFRDLPVGTDVSQIETELSLPSPTKVLRHWDEDFVRFVYRLPNFTLFFFAVAKDDRYYYVGVYEVISNTEMAEIDNALRRYADNEFRMFIELGRIKEKYGKIGLAFRNYQLARRVNPTHPLPYKLLGLLELKRGNVEEAATYIRESLRLNPNQEALQVLLESLPIK